MYLNTKIGKTALCNGFGRVYGNYNIHINMDETHEIIPSRGTKEALLPVLDMRSFARLKGKQACRQNNSLDKIN